MRHPFVTRLRESSIVAFLFVGDAALETASRLGLSGEDNYYVAYELVKQARLLRDDLVRFRCAAASASVLGKVESIRGVQSHQPYPFTDDKDLSNTAR